MMEIKAPIHNELSIEIFDLEWYKIASGSDFSSSEEALLHYTNSGSRLGISCSPYLDERYYMTLYPDVRQAGLTALDHYILYGDGEDRNPHPLINIKWYRNKYSCENNVLSDLKHREDKFGVSTSPVFDSSWYAKRYGIKSQPLLHYILSGHDPAFSPNPAFDALYVKNLLAVPPGENIYAAYARADGRNTNAFHPVFDLEYFRAHVSGSGNSHNHTHDNVFEEFILSPTQAEFNAIFSREYYRQNYMSGDTGNEFVDFLSDPRSYKNPHPMFSTKYYYEQRPDVWSANVNAFVHFCLEGFSELTSPHPLFDCEEYLRINSDVRALGINPLVHYMKYGRTENRKIRQQAHLWHGTRRIDRYNIYSSNTELPAVEAPIVGVFAHIYYADLAEEIISCANNIDGNCKVFISTNSKHNAYSINRAFSRLSKHDFEIRVLENRGRDIAPMIVGYKDRLQEVDIALHIHTKRSKHYEAGFDKWRRYLLDQNCGSKARAKQILKLFADPSIGAIAPFDFPAIEKVVNWGHNFDSANRLIDMMSDREFTLGRMSRLELPSGSMFWFRTNALQPLLKLNLPYEIFDPEEGQIDGTLAHAIERVFFYVVELAGYSWLRFKATNAIDEQPVFQEGKLLPILSGTRPAVAANPEMRNFTAVKSSIDRPRLNLLIPTAEKSFGYAGISEALRLFDGIAQLLRPRFDLRIIATDVPFSENIDIESGAEIGDMEVDDSSSNYLFVDATQRAHQLLSVRRNDIFVATAWWNAAQAKILVGQQERFYGIDSRKFVYLIQDYECGFYPWSSRYAFAESTYKDRNMIIPIFNTEILAQFFFNQGYFENGIIYNPPINEQIASVLNPNSKKEKIVLIYMRRAALRNCLEFADAVVFEAIKRDPEYWSDWQFIAIGEDFDPRSHTRSGVITGGSRLSLMDYGNLLSRAAVGLSFMVSPHPSYPPLEMAAAGMKVITNTYMNKNLSSCHTSIKSFDVFDEGAVAALMKSCAKEAINSSVYLADAAKCDWFFEGKTNMQKVFTEAAGQISGMLSVG